MLAWFMRCSAATVFCVGVVFSLAQFSSQGRTEEVVADAGRGEAIAQRLCVNCHVVAHDSNAVVPAGIPTFDDIANRVGQTGEKIRGVLLSPHEPMPDMHLSRSEIDDLIAYIETLRDKASGQPLMPKKLPKKSKQIYPDAS